MDSLAPDLLELPRHIVAAGIGDLGVLHGGLNVLVADPVLDALDAEPFTQEMGGAAVFEDMEMPQFWAAARPRRRSAS